MRKLALLGVLAGFMLLGSSAANAQYGMAGCGLGSLLFGKDTTTLMQIMAETTTPVELVMIVKSESHKTPALASACSDERAVARAEAKAARGYFVAEFE